MPKNRTIYGRLKREYKDELVSSNYTKNRNTMGELHRFIIFIRNISLGLGIVLIIISILLNFNTIRMSLYANRKEFEIMRLVGASNLYVKLPTIFEGLLYGVTSSIITIIVLMITIYTFSLQLMICLILNLAYPT